LNTGRTQTISLLFLACRETPNYLLLVLPWGGGKYLLLLLEYRLKSKFSAAAAVAVIQENPQISAAAVSLRGRSNYLL
jgi:hypothetical protein